MKPNKNSTTKIEADGPNGDLKASDIALAAYTLWEKEGRLQGRDMDYWLRAETLLRQTRVQAQTQPAPVAQQ